MIIKSKLRLCLLLIFILFFAGIMMVKGAHATVYTWDGLGNGTTWEDGDNWNPNAPAGGPVAGDSATIDLASAPNVTIAGATTVSKLTIGGTNTSTLTLGGYDLNVTYVDATYNGDLTIGTNGTLDASTGTPTITVAGNWDSSAGTFTYGNSTVKLEGDCGGTCNLTTPAGNWYSIYAFHKLTIGAGANITLASASGFYLIWDDGDLTISGTLTIPSGKTIGVYACSTCDMTINNGGLVNGAGTLHFRRYSGHSLLVNNGTISVGTFRYDSQNGYTILATTYGGNLYVRDDGASDNTLYLTTGTLVVGDGDDELRLFHVGPDATRIILENSNNTNITVNGDLIMEHPTNPAKAAKFIAGTGNTIDVNGNVSITNSTGASSNEIDAGSASWTVAGNWTNNDTFTADTSTVTFDGSSGIQSVNSGGDSFYNVGIDNSGTSVQLSGNALTASNNLTITSGTLDINGQNLTVSGTFTNNGTLQLEGGETVSTPVNNSGSLVKYDGTSGPYTLKNWTYDSLQLSSSSATTYNMSAHLTLNGSLTIDANNTLDTNNYNLYVAGDWTNNGTFTAGTGTVTLDGTGTQDITSGSSPFNTIEITNSSNTVTFLDDLTATNFTSNTGSVAMEFTAGDDYTITNLTLNGAPGNLISLRSTIPGSYWYLNVSGAQSLSYVDVSDSNASGGNPVVCSNECIGLNENNDNWVGLLVSIPTMTEWGMIIFVVLAGLGAIYYLPTGRQV